MDNLVVASSEQDAIAVAAVERHHAHLAGALAIRVESLLAEVAKQDTTSPSPIASSKVIRGGIRARDSTVRSTGLPPWAAG